MWEKQGEEHGGKSWVSEEHEGIPSLHLTAQGMRRGRKEAAAPTMCWGHQLCEMFPSPSVTEGPKLAVCGSKVLLGVAVQAGMSQGLWEILEALSPLTLPPPPISRATFEPQGSHPCELHGGTRRAPQLEPAGPLGKAVQHFPGEVCLLLPLPGFNSLGWIVPCFSASG